MEQYYCTVKAVGNVANIAIYIYAMKESSFKSKLESCRHFDRCRYSMQIGRFEFDGSSQAVLCTQVLFEGQGSIFFDNRCPTPMA